ncbi:MAG: flavodoxin family protein [Candidatus Hermodarchaeia archaeon]|jgi:flavodoxin
MKKAIVIFDSKFGNTEKVARALASGLDEPGIVVECINVKNVQIDTLPDYDLLAVGGPTHGFGMSKPVKEFFKQIGNIDLREKNAFAFDTKNPPRYWGSAAKGIEKRLVKLGMKIVRSRLSAFVEGLKGPLHENSEETFRKIGVEIAKLL